jgi:hypothetical protein
MFLVWFIETCGYPVLYKKVVHILHATFVFNDCERESALIIVLVLSPTGHCPLNTGSVFLRVESKG